MLIVEILLLVAVAIRLDALLQNFVGGLCNTDLLHIKWEIFIGVPVKIVDSKEVFCCVSWNIIRHW